MSTPYRDDLDALRTRHAALQEELTAVQRRARELSESRGDEARLRRELDELGRRIAAAANRRSLPLLDNLQIASPCSAPWDDMIGDERVRFCAHCRQDVFNLSAMSKDAAETLLRERAGAACVRFFRRADGTLLTSDCSVGVRRKRRRRVAAAAVMAATGSGLLSAAAALAFPRQPSPQATTGVLTAVTGGPAPMALMGDPVVEAPTQTPAVIGSSYPTRPLAPPRASYWPTPDRAGASVLVGTPGPQAALRPEPTSGDMVMGKRAAPTSTPPATPKRK